MKKFILGFICGVIVTVVAAMGFGYYASSKANSGEMPGLTRIEKEEVIPYKQVRIFQVLKPNMALAYLTKYPDKTFDSEEIVVLYIGEEKANLYDDQKINVPSGKSVKRIGTYEYYTKKDQLRKTVPAVEIK